MAAKNSISIVIPSYNGLERIKENFPRLVASLNDGYFLEWIVVDDGSKDDTVEWMVKNFPNVRLIQHSENRGFIPSVNRGVAESRHEWVVLLNNDILAANDFLAPAIHHLDNPKLFAVSFQALSPQTGLFREGAKSARFSAGFFKILHAERHQPSPQLFGIPSLYPVGGHCIVRREMFLALGGFDPLFEPFYWEDVDLGYRAWKEGWQVIYEPQCRVIHNEMGTIRSLFKEKKIKQIRGRNRLLFIWKNIQDGQMVARHWMFLILRLVFSWLYGNFLFYSIFFAAIKNKLRRADSRILSKSGRKKPTDREIMSRFYKV